MIHRIRSLVARTTKKLFNIVSCSSGSLSQPGPLTQNTLNVQPIKTGMQMLERSPDGKVLCWSNDSAANENEYSCSLPDSGTVTPNQLSEYPIPTNQIEYTLTGLISMQQQCTHVVGFDFTMPAANEVQKSGNDANVAQASNKVEVSSDYWESSD